MDEFLENPVLEFHYYPPVGPEDWRYVYATAEVRALETTMPTRATLLDMVNAAGFEEAVELLNGTEYALATGGGIAALEQILLERRDAVRSLFEELMIDEEIVEVFKGRADFANMRLALRRTLTEKPIGIDYSSDGNISAEIFEEVFEQENYDLLPDYIQEAVEQAVLRYYGKKDIRQIDYAIDSVQAGYNLRKAQQLESVFLRELFRMQIDLTNIRTMLRVKWTQSELRDVFVDGGYIERGLFVHCLDLGYEALPTIFWATPYHDIVEGGTTYLVNEGSFLRLEELCDSHLKGFLKTTFEITAGPQPVIAYLLMKEHEIRTVRMILTGKKNNLDVNLILDRLSD